MSNISTLRAVTKRLNATPIEELPCQVGFLATSISSCENLLKTPSSNNDHAVLVHKLKTRISALLQDRTPEGRFCGIHIAKAVVETGGISVLSDSSNWIRAIISCLNKSSDAPEIKKLAILTITRMYLLTVEHQAAVRSITIPTLPAFFSATLGVIRPLTDTIDGKTTRALSPLLEVVLHSWNTLIEHFYSTIRPNVTSMRSICLSLIGDDSCPLNVQTASEVVLARLHFCAPRNSAATEWSQSCAQIVEACHDTTDLVFRAVIEDWTSVSPRTSKVTRKQKSASIPSTTSSDVVGIESWSGVSQGCSRISNHLALLQQFLTDRHASEMDLPLGLVFDLTTRLSAITLPSSTYSPRINGDVTRDEREELWLHLPRIHSRVLHLYKALIDTYGQSLLPVSHIISSHLWDIFDAESEHEGVRKVAYSMLTSMLTHRLLILSKNDSSNIKRLVKLCCEDLKPLLDTSTRDMSLSNGSTDAKKSTSTGAQSTGSTNSRNMQTQTDYTRTELYASAYALLPAIITVNLSVLEGSSSIRAQLDSTAILINHHEAILASVLNPATSQVSGKQSKQKATGPSLLPFLARSAESTIHARMSNMGKLGYEALLRPRMPIVQSRAKEISDSTATDEAEEDSDDLPGHNGYQNNDIDIEMALDPLNNGTRTTDDHLIRDSIDNPNGSTKRDFTTLLEQSANEQLAASSSDMATNTPAPSHSTSSEQPNPLVSRDYEDAQTIKRQKTTLDTENTSQATNSTRQIKDDNDSTLYPTTSSSVSNPPNPRTRTQISAKATSSHIDEENTPQKQHKQTVTISDTTTTTTTDTTPKYNQDYDTNSDADSSDSEVPAIDATLVEFTDSEDEQEISAGI